MKNKIIVGVLFVCNITAHNMFYFKTYKEEHSLSQSFLKNLKELFQSTVFIETGTLSGGTTVRAAKVFESVHTIELHPGLYQRAKKLLATFPNVTVYEGSSPDVFTKILPSLEGNTLFWLDAHYSGSTTAKPKMSPIFLELQAIKKYYSYNHNCVILIDDILNFGSYIDGAFYVSDKEYPTIQEIITILQSINKDFGYALLGNVLMAYDRTVYQPNLSPVVQACTMNRLFSDCVDDEILLLNDAIIGKAQGEELITIGNLYRSSNNQSAEKEFTYDLWKALTCINEKNFSIAQCIFQNIIEKKQYNNRRMQRYNAIIKVHLSIEEIANKAYLSIKEITSKANLSIKEVTGKAHLSIEEIAANIF